MRDGGVFVTSYEDGFIITYSYEDGHYKQLKQCIIRNGEIIAFSINSHISWFKGGKNGSKKEIVFWYPWGSVRSEFISDESIHSSRFTCSEKALTKQDVSADSYEEAKKKYPSFFKKGWLESIFGR